MSRAHPNYGFTLGVGHATSHATSHAPCCSIVYDLHVSCQELYKNMLRAFCIYRMCFCASNIHKLIHFLYIFVILTSLHLYYYYYFSITLAVLTRYLLSLVANVCELPRTRLELNLFQLGAD